MEYQDSNNQSYSSSSSVITPESSNPRIAIDSVSKYTDPDDTPIPKPTVGHKLCTYNMTINMVK